MCCQQGADNHPITMYVIALDKQEIKVALSFPTVPCMEIAVGTLTDTTLTLSTIQPVGRRAFPTCDYTARLIGKTTLKGEWQSKDQTGKKQTGTFYFHIPNPRN